MENKIKVAIVGYGNIGKYSLEAIESAGDCEISGIIRRDSSKRENIPDRIPLYSSLSEMVAAGIRPDVAILATPTRKVKEYAVEALKLGINTVDSFDIHTRIPELRSDLDKLAKECGRVSVTAAGWDPGSDSVVRTLMEAIAPKGITYTNFGPGMSMGHTVAVKAIEGVKDALSMTIPLGTGIHRRMVYVELHPGYDIEQISKEIKEDPYFSSDETHVFEVPCVDALKDMGHGVHMERKGVSGKTQSQRFSFDMAINNPALTAQILVACARASMRLTPGCYTMIEIPVIDLLEGDREKWIGRLV